jgi:hypothetical protein
MTRLFPIALAVLLAAVVVVAPAAAPDRKPPRIVAATMLDADGNSRADRVRLTYSERVRHPADADGRYPLAVSGYRIRSVGKAAGKTLAILLVEQAQPDPEAAPTIRYRRTKAQPVKDRAGNQALAQLFAGTKPHGKAPTPPPGPADTDRDGTVDADDCAPRDASIHPGAPDVPDLDFVDSNCDRIDGTEKDAVFASPNGDDQNPGTKERPKRQIETALLTAVKGGKRYVLVAFGSYDQIGLVSGKSIFGGYDPTSWARRDRFPDGLPVISGSPQAVEARGAKDVVLQHLSVRGLPDSRQSAYGIRAVANSSLTLQRVVVSAGNGTAGIPGADGPAGRRALDGDPGKPGSCDGDEGTSALGGVSPVDRRGGYGGRGGAPSAGPNWDDGAIGGQGSVGTPGGAGGAHGNPGKPGLPGTSGEPGRSGRGGAGGTSPLSTATDRWVLESLGSGGTGGLPGEHGNGGGGGGGGGSQQGNFVNNGGGNGGGGGGGGGGAGSGAGAGSPGGGSFGIFLQNSKIVVESSSIAAGNGGAGGRGGDGGRGGAGGRGGRGARVCTSEVGAGGNGGAGGAGGRGGGGGGGAGGPSVGIFKVGTSTASLKGDSKVTAGTPGAGGAVGASGPGGA